MTFALLAFVTALAVLLSIRRESLFIAVLGLLGGFATPALLSTGENRPIPLFAYLLLLNIGLAWVAYRRGWSSLTWLSLALTTIYQWGWVFRFLDAGSVSLAMGIFIIFPLAGLTALILAGRPGEGDAGVRAAASSAAHSCRRRCRCCLPHTWPRFPSTQHARAFCSGSSCSSTWGCSPSRWRDGRNCCTRPALPERC